MIRTSIETIIVAVIFGYIFFLLHIPLPWILGPITGMILWSTLVKRKVYIHSGVRNTSMIVLGYLIGTSFTLEAGGEIARQLPYMMLSTVIMVIYSLFAGWMFAKWTGISISTAIIGSVPGGFTQMAVLGEEVKDADVTTITFMQTIRLLTIVFVVPFLALHTFPHRDSTQIAISNDIQYSHPISWQSALFIILVLISPFIAKKIKLPTIYFMGPVLSTVILILLGLHPVKLPELWVILAQIALGIYLGSTMQITQLKNWKHLLPLTMSISATMLLISFGLSLLFSDWLPISLLSAFLSIAPGGMTEMGVTAAFTGGDVTIVSAYQLFRILFILMLVPPFIKWLLSRIRKERNS